VVDVPDISQVEGVNPLGSGPSAAAHALASADASPPMTSRGAADAQDGAPRWQSATVGLIALLAIWLGY